MLYPGEEPELRVQEDDGEKRIRKDTKFNNGTRLASNESPAQIENLMPAGEEKPTRSGEAEDAVISVRWRKIECVWS